MRLQRLISTRLASSGRDTSDMAEAGRIVFCWHFCWHSRVEEIQILAALAVRIGGGGRNRTGLARITTPAPLPATRGAQPQCSRTPIESGVFVMLSSTRQNSGRMTDESESTPQLLFHWHFHWHFLRHKQRGNPSIGDIHRHHRCATRLTPADAVLSCSPACARASACSAQHRAGRRKEDESLRLPSLSC